MGSESLVRKHCRHIACAQKYCSVSVDTYNLTLQKKNYTLERLQMSNPGFLMVYWLHTGIEHLGKSDRAGALQGFCINW